MELKDKVQRTLHKKYIKNNLLERNEKYVDLTPKAAKLYKAAISILRKKRYANKQNIKLKQHLKNMKHLFSSHFITRYNKLSKTQKIFIQMQLRTAQQSRQVSGNNFIHRNDTTDVSMFLNVTENGNKNEEHVRESTMGFTVIDYIKCTTVQPNYHNVSRVIFLSYLFIHIF